MALRGWPQFTSHLAGQRPRAGPVRELIGWMQQKLAADLRVETLRSGPA